MMDTLYQLAWLLLEVVALIGTYRSYSWFNNRWMHAALWLTVIIQVVVLIDTAHENRSEKITLARLSAEDDDALKEALMDPRDTTEFRDVP